MILDFLTLAGRSFSSIKCPCISVILTQQLICCESLRLSPHMEESGSACVPMCKVCLFDPCSLPCPKGGWPDHDVYTCNLAKSPKESVGVSLHGLA